MNGSLYFTKVDESHAGSYTCTPFNDLGTDGPSPVINVIVLRPPIFTVTPKAIYIQKLGETVQLPCQAIDRDGTNHPTIDWKRVGALHYTSILCTTIAILSHTIHYTQCTMHSWQRLTDYNAPLVQCKSICSWTTVYSEMKCSERLHKLTQIPNQTNPIRSGPIRSVAGLTWQFIVHCWQKVPITTPIIPASPLCNFFQLSTATRLQDKHFSM